MSTQQVPARAQRLHWLWSRLGADPMSEDAFIEAIMTALDRGVGAEADASAWRHQLVGSGAFIATQDPDGRITYRKAETFPTLPPVGPGTPAFDQQSAELAAEEQAAHDRDTEEAWRNSPQRRQAEELDAHIRQVANEVIDARIDELRATYESAALRRARLLLKAEQDAEAEAPATTTTR